jgi:predicted transcriptional regulator of viral defense system
MHKAYRTAEALFQENKGTLRFSQAQKLGITGTTIARMTAAGLLIRVTRGVYRLASRPDLTYPDFVTVALRSPHAVICLISALHFHQLTTQIPHQVYIALPINRTKAPRTEYPPTRVVTLSTPAYSAGIETHTLDDVPVKIYSMEKTIADCFKFRRLVGNEVALEALKMFFAEHSPNIPMLLSYARLNRVEKIMRPYLALYQ